MTAIWKFLLNICQCFCWNLSVSCILGCFIYLRSVDHTLLCFILRTQEVFPFFRISLRVVSSVYMISALEIYKCIWAEIAFHVAVSDKNILFLACFIYLRSVDHTLLGFILRTQEVFPFFRISLRFVSPVYIFSTLEISKYIWSAPWKATSWRCLG